MCHGTMPRGGPRAAEDPPSDRGSGRDRIAPRTTARTPPARPPRAGHPDRRPASTRRSPLQLPGVPNCTLQRWTATTADARPRAATPKGPGRSGPWTVTPRPGGLPPGADEPAQRPRRGEHRRANRRRLPAGREDPSRDRSLRAIRSSRARIGTRRAPDRGERTRRGGAGPPDIRSPRVGR